MEELVILPQRPKDSGRIAVPKGQYVSPRRYCGGTTSSGTFFT